MAKVEIEKSLLEMTNEYESYFEHLKFMFRSGALKKSEFIKYVTNVYNSLKKYLNTIFEQNILEKTNSYVKNFENLLNNIKDFLDKSTIKRPRNLFNEQNNNSL